MRVSPILSLTKLHPWPLPSTQTLQESSCRDCHVAKLNLTCPGLGGSWSSLQKFFPSKPLFGTFSVHWDTTRYRGSVILWMSSSNSCPIQSARVGIVLSWKTRVLGSQYLTCLLSDFDLHASSSQTRWSSIIQFLSKFYLLFIHSIF